MIKTIADLMRWAATKPPGYADRVLARATSRNETEYEISDEAWAELAAEFKAELRPKPTQRPVEQVPEGWTAEDVKAGLDSKGSEGCGC